MLDKQLWLVIAIGLLSLMLLTQELRIKEKEAIFHKGISYASWQHEAYNIPKTAGSISLVQKIKVKWVSLVVTWYQETADSPIICRDPYLTPDDEGLIQTIKLIHRLGMKVMLKPTVDIKDGTWRGEIRFDNQEDWRAWFSSYRYFINHYAQLAAKYGVEEFAVGVELAGTVHREREWRWIITKVRKRFKGPLTYAANWDSFKKVDFWDALNYVGIDAYFELSVGSNPKLKDLLSAWTPWAEELKSFHEKVNKPILFTEIGCRSVSGASAQPWNWTGSGKIDLQEQAHYYEAAFRTFWDKSWFYGFYWWAWDPMLREFGEANTSYTPHGKPAEKILANWYGKKIKRK